MPDPQPPTGGMNSRRRSPIRGGRAVGHRSARWAGAAVSLLMLWVSLSAVLGCGNGALAFDGGHIPVGGGTAASLISGTAYAAEDYTTPVPGATVTVTNTTIAGNSRTQTTTTAANGSFTFPNGFPDAAGVANRYQISVSPPVGSSLVSQQISFPVDPGQSATVLVALPQGSFNESQAAAVTILQQSYQLHTGDTIAIGAELLDLQGGALGVSPSLVFTGSFGVISAGGLFTSTTAGIGTISAYWFTGVEQLQSSPATITSNKSISVQPPPPPPPITGPTTVPAS